MCNYLLNIEMRYKLCFNGYIWINIKRSQSCPYLDIFDLKDNSEWIHAYFWIEAGISTNTFWWLPPFVYCLNIENLI